MAHQELARSQTFQSHRSKSITLYFENRAPGHRSHSRLDRPIKIYPCSAFWTLKLLKPYSKGVQLLLELVVDLTVTHILLIFQARRMPELWGPKASIQNSEYLGGQTVHEAVEVKVLSRSQKAGDASNMESLPKKMADNQWRQPK